MAPLMASFDFNPPAMLHADNSKVPKIKAIENLRNGPLLELDKATTTGRELSKGR
jgi:hypothetical protein